MERTVWWQKSPAALPALLSGLKVAATYASWAVESGIGSYRDLIPAAVKTDIC